ncbi:autotransporter outer membrane beta-barrel domain-containing protein [Mesorhizobium sp. VK22B]|uniref:Autotransporter outer membrane beta-barrel domain-containing protein n=1 Tax=Mesorhizobium captivum TaxID=3072319 RepID=A0ABU4Z1U5_9HYPH|nr:autotransporter domain-containing protein [Mesorhizobium sp. VK22B]MDX8493023.1 autotransporter outer membrane beta-barrel domain-containing protein [Mesorhizobium sp. VK22B]
MGTRTRSGAVRRRALLCTTSLVALGWLATTPSQATDWTGTASYDWFYPGNWSAGIPTATSNARIDTVTPNATVVVASGAQASFLFVGDLGTGTLTIQDGGKVNSTFGFIGFGNGSIGTGTVDGTSSAWTNLGNLAVGESGAGTLKILNGGTVSNFNGYVGYNTGSTGTVTVDGAGSTWANSGELYVGEYGTGTLNIQNGGAVSNTFGFIGFATGSIGTATVDGAGSTWTNFRNLIVGDAGTGMLTIQNGGKVSNSIGYIGYDLGSTGTVTVDGAGSSWTNSSLNYGLYVGYAGTGTLNILNGGKVTNNLGIISSSPGSTGVVTVDGVGSSWSNFSNLTIGYSGTGALTVQNGGTVNNTVGQIGFAPDSTGTVTVDGAGSTWINSGDLHVGEYGAGTLNILNGGGVSSFQGYIGHNTGSTGIVTVDGAGSIWGNSSGLYVGESGTGTLKILNGGTVASWFGFIADGAGSIGTVTVDGAGSSWSNFSGLYVGNFGTGMLNIQNGGTVSSDVGQIGNYLGSIGTVTVDGAGSSWSNLYGLYVGYAGTGTLTVQNGSKVGNSDGFIALNSGSTGTVSVDGAGSSWTNLGNLYVGNSGTGTLNILNGGEVSSFQGYIGKNTGSTGTVTVDGAGSSWTNSNLGYGLFVGYAGTGTLKILNGGKVTNSIGVIAYGDGSTGIVTVDGAGSSWTNFGNLDVGSSGTGTLTVQNGGKVSNTLGYVAYSSGTTGTVTVDGAGSTWANSGELHVGEFGTGTLTIRNGGIVSAESVEIASQSNSTGTLNIGAGLGQTAAAPGTLNSPTVVFGKGTGKIVFNHTASNYVFVPAISGAGSVTVEAGTTILAANNTYTGPTTVDDGKLVVNGSIASSFTTVNDGGALGGIGTIGGLIVNSGGAVAPGNSIGTLKTTGNVTFNPGSIYQVEVNATGQSDRIDATGIAAINGGTVQVFDASGVYALGSHYTLLTAAGGVSGAFADVTQASPVSTPFLSFGLSYDPYNVYLDIARSAVTFASFGQTPNQMAIGGGLDSVPLSSPLVNAVAQLDAPSARSAFDQLSGEAHASAKTALIEDSRFVREAAIDRLRSAFDAVGAVKTPVMSYASGGPEYLPATTDRFALWGRAFGSWGHTDGDGNAARLNRSTGGFFVGGDGLVFDTWRLGLLAGYSRTNFNVRDRSSSGTSDNYHLGLYGGTQGSNLAFRTGAAYTWHDIATSRFVSFPGFANSLKGKYDASTAQVFGELAYGTRAGNVGFEPFANLAYVNLHTDGFRETGGAAALFGSGGQTDATFSTLGLRASTTFDLGGVNVTSGGTLAWRHAFGDVVPLSTMALADGAPFTIDGVPIARNAAVIEAGLDFAIAPSATLGISYNSQFASGVSDQSVRGTFNWKF